jgi:hypothetical protein
MKRLSAPGLLLLAATVLTSCGDDDVTGLTLRSLSGSWTASSFAFTSVAHPAHRVDLIADLSGSLTLNLQANGTFTGTIHLPGTTPIPLPIGGTVGLDADAGTMDVRFNQQTHAYGFFNDFLAHFTLDAGRTTLTWDFGPTPWDFPQNPGTGEEPATARVVLTRS